MKKLILILSLLALTVGCKKEQEGQEGPKEIGSWRSVHQYYRVTVDPSDSDAVREMVEKEMETDVTEEESYILTFYEDGTGYGSCPRSDSSGRFDFWFTWEIFPGGVLYIKRDMERTVNHSYIGILHAYGSGNAYTGFPWNIEESNGDRMVLSSAVADDDWAEVDGQLPDGTLAPWIEYYFYRYTFERVK